LLLTNGDEYQFGETPEVLTDTRIKSAFNFHSWKADLPRPGVIREARGHRSVRR